MRSPVATSNGCAPVLASYSAITRFTSSMSAVAGSYSSSVVSPWDENVRILAFMLVSCGTSIAVFCGTAVSGARTPGLILHLFSNLSRHGVGHDLEGEAKYLQYFQLPGDLLVYNSWRRRWRGGIYASPDTVTFGRAYHGNHLFGGKLPSQLGTTSRAPDSHRTGLYQRAS